ncbi:MAG: SUMF1/EgtB/PvdO family nonheme iron enzyme [Phycisphaerae bacterium]|nr:SUMF1/EgtB/PvdO family nonheme iron enzyme [Phycisphaerae bacterium]
MVMDPWRRNPLFLFLVAAIGLLVEMAAASQASHAIAPKTPSWCVKKATWQETMLSAREALTKQKNASGKGALMPDFGRPHFTVMAWIRTTVGGVIFSKSSPEGDWTKPGNKAFLVDSGNLQLAMDATRIGCFPGDTTVTDGKWHHVAVTCHPAGADFPHGIEFYLDGKLDRERRVDALPSDGLGQVVRIGSAGQGRDAPTAFQGDIDELCVYDRNLSSAEIKRCYEAPPPEPQTGCVGYWAFDRDGSDDSGNGNHALVKNATPVEGRSGRALHFDGRSRVEVDLTQAVMCRRTLWKLLECDFAAAPLLEQMKWEREDHIWNTAWNPGDLTVLARRYAEACSDAALLQRHVRRLAIGADDAATLARVRQAYYLFKDLRVKQSPLLSIDFKSLRLAVTDLADTFGQEYPSGKDYLAKLDTWERRVPGLLDRLAMGDRQAAKDADRLVAFCREVLLANPLLDFDRMLLIDHDRNDLEYKYGYVKSKGLPMNYEGNSSLHKTGYDNRIAILSPLGPDARLTTLFRPEGGQLVSDVDLHFDANKLLFSMPGKNGRWQIFEMNVDGTGVRQLPLIEQADVDNYDACYLPDGNILFTSSACFTGVPCVAGFHHVAQLHRLDVRTGNIRRLTFEQDHDWCPTVLNDGRVLYTRWEYTDLPHYLSRILFHMNPDGTGQMEYYGSNSNWPTAMFYARPVPNHPTKFVAVVGGHHGAPRMGELVLFDPAKGRREADGVIQRIPGYGKPVEPIIRDTLADHSWPKFLHPYPLSDKYFIVSARPAADSNWGIYLVDVFDNMLLLKAVEGRHLLEPIPLRKTKTPPIIADKVEPERTDALVHLIDVYAGDGLKGIPRGTVKKLRVFTYHFAYHGMGGQQNRVGLDGPWDVKRVLGTVPVAQDGSALFRVPANTPISIQPLDAEGKALQLMRSWMTAMPGEVLSCVGCHERQGTTPPVKQTLALRQPPSEIAPWHGPTRGFSFNREVQPVLDKYCVACHDGRPRPDGKSIPDLRAKPYIVQKGTKYTPSYWALRRFVRTTTMEGDMHLLAPCEYHADNTELIQVLSKGHHNVQVDAEAWDRLITWIDLHAPAHGTWHELMGTSVAHMRDRRRAMMKRYATGRDEDPEAIPDTPVLPIEPIMPDLSSEPPSPPVACLGWPFDADQASRRQRAAGRHERTIDLGGGVKLELVRIPAGQFVMGDSNGDLDERPSACVTIDRPFWMGRFEVTNEQFRRFDPSHDSRFEPGDFIQLGIKERGYLVNRARQPVVRVSWHQASAFCRWLSARAGEAFNLPTEAQWEYACRAGTSSPFWHGGCDVDFSSFANLADASLKHVDTFDFGFPSSCVPPWRPAIDTVNDRFRVSAPVGTYQPNPWGLFDMHGNVAEWTQTLYRPYPYRDGDGRNDPDAQAKRVVRGGSWYNRPKRARSAFRLAYQPFRGVYNVGFRVISPIQVRTAAALNVRAR